MTNLITHAPGLARSIGLLLGALFLFVLLDSTAKHLAQTYPVPMLVWARYTVHFLLMVVFLAPSMRMRLISTTRPARQIIRAVCLLGTTCFGMAALSRMPLAETTAIVFAAPLIVTLLARPLLGEHIGGMRWIAALIGFVGVLLIARPGSGLVPSGIALALGGAMSYALYQILTRQLSTTENPVAMLFYTALIGTLAMTLLLPWIWGGPMPGLRDALLIASLGIYGGTGHFLLIRAFASAPASVLSPILYVQLIWAMLVGWALFGHFPDEMALIGILTIGAAGVIIAIDSRRAGASSRHKV
ncbi:DMT family transporter [Azoarcus sp. L1K30]|uniref:DMT family transporter n=1 Tax=Azoarcus sp. L1K30 TaxID=2820277 RepID=UPI00201154E7|nr:DMT family transporter [Azoarcus sp. L1K30]